MRRVFSKEGMFRSFGTDRSKNSKAADASAGSSTGIARESYEAQEARLMAVADNMGRPVHQLLGRELQPLPHTYIEASQTGARSNSRLSASSRVGSTSRMSERSDHVAAAPSLIRSSMEAVRLGEITPSSGMTPSASYQGSSILAPPTPVRSTHLPRDPVTPARSSQLMHTMGHVMEGSKGKTPTGRSGNQHATGTTGETDNATAEDLDAARKSRRKKRMLEPLLSSRIADVFNGSGRANEAGSSSGETTEPSTNESSSETDVSGQ